MRTVLGGLIGAWAGGVLVALTVLAYNSSVALGGNLVDQDVIFEIVGAGVAVGAVIGFVLGAVLDSPRPPDA